MTSPVIIGEGLPTLVTRAGQRLLDARSSAEVLEAKQLAEAALHYAKVTKAANETHADCLRIITRAEMRMADEIDRGQANGEVRTRADNQLVRNSDKLAFGDLGIDRQRVAELGRRCAHVGVREGSRQPRQLRPRPIGDAKAMIDHTVVPRELVIE